MGATLKGQALTLTLANGYTRALGLLLRLVTARLMGAEAMGVMELSSSAVMMAITPVTAGVPTAMSRLAARPGADAEAVLKAGVSWVARAALFVTPVMLLCAPAASLLLGDWRTLPAILTGAPMVALLGLCAVYSGWFCGRGDMRSPALNECTEQTVRCLMAAGLLVTFAGRSIALTAALPGVAEVIAGICVMLLFRRSAPHLPAGRADPALLRELTGLTAPTVLARLTQTAMRAMNAVLLPVCLRRSGLSAAAATAGFGLLSGMAMPLTMLPGIVTTAMSTVATPAVSRQEGSPRHLKSTMRRMLLAACAVGGAAGLLLFIGADFISLRIYHEPALAPLLRLLSPLSLLTSVTQIQFGMINGLGLQRRALTGAVACSALNLVLTALLCPLPGLRLTGAAVASLASTALRVLWNARVLRHN